MEKNSIVICQGSSCFSRGNKENLRAIQSFLKNRKINIDILFKGQLCTGNCQQGPIILVNDEMFSDVKPEDIEQILLHKLKLD